MRVISWSYVESTGIGQEHYWLSTLLSMTCWTCEGTLDKKFSPVSRSTRSTETRKLFHPEPLTLLSLGIITAIASGVRHQCRTAPTRMRRARRRSIVKAAVLSPTGSLLASISTHARVKHSSIKVQTASVKLSSLGFRECARANSNSQQFLWHSCKNHKNHKLLIFTPL